WRGPRLRAARSAARGIPEVDCSGGESRHGERIRTGRTGRAGTNASARSPGANLVSPWVAGSTASTVSIRQEPLRSQRMRPFFLVKGLEKAGQQNQGGRDQHKRGQQEQRNKNSGQEMPGRESQEEMQAKQRQQQQQRNQQQSQQQQQ